MQDTLRAHKSTAYSEVRYSPSPLYTLVYSDITSPPLGYSQGTPTTHQYH